MQPKKLKIETLPYDDPIIVGSKIDISSCTEDMQNMAEAISFLYGDDDLSDLVHSHGTTKDYIETVLGWKDIKKKDNVLQAFKCSLTVPFDLYEENLHTTEGVIKHLCRQYLKLQFEDPVHWGTASVSAGDSISLNADSVDNDEVFEAYYKQWLNHKGVKEYWEKIVLVLLTSYWLDQCSDRRKFVILSMLRANRLELSYIPYSTIEDICKLLPPRASTISRRSSASAQDSVLVKATCSNGEAALSWMVDKYLEDEEWTIDHLKQYICSDSIQMMDPYTTLELIGSFCNDEEKDTDVNSLDYSKTMLLLYLLEAVVDRYPVLGLSKILYYLSIGDTRYSVHMMQAKMLRLEEQLANLSESKDSDEYHHRDCKC